MTYVWDISGADITQTPPYSIFAWVLFLSKPRIPAICSTPNPIQTQNSIDMIEQTPKIQIIIPDSQTFKRDHHLLGFHPIIIGPLSFQELHFFELLVWDFSFNSLLLVFFRLSIFPSKIHNRGPKSHMFNAGQMSRPPLGGSILSSMLRIWLSRFPADK